MTYLITVELVLLVFIGVVLWLWVSDPRYKNVTTWIDYVFVVVIWFGFWFATRMPHMMLEGKLWYW